MSPDAEAQNSELERLISDNKARLKQAQHTLADLKKRTSAIRKTLKVAIGEQKTIARGKK